MKEKLTKAEYEKENPLIIMSADGKFYVGKGVWSDEYPDARKFKPTGEKREAVRIAGEVRGKVVNRHGYNDEEIIADCTPKPWLVVLKRGGTKFVGEFNLSEIAEELGVEEDDIRTTTRVLYEDGKPISADDNAINDAVRTLIDRMGEEGKSLCLLTDNGKAPFILPALINGGVEYQVSDGIDGERGMSWDAYTWSEAMANWTKMMTELAHNQ